MAPIDIIVLALIGIAFVAVCVRAHRKGICAECGTTHRCERGRGAGSTAHGPASILWRGRGVVLRYRFPYTYVNVCETEAIS